MKDLIKKYEELLKIAQDHLELQGNQSKRDAIIIDINIFLTIIEDLRNIEKEQDVFIGELREKLDDVNKNIDDLKAPKLDAKGKELTIIQRLKSLNTPPAFENNERILLKRLVTNEIETPRKKYGTIKMNTLFTLQEKLKK